ncbi:MAG: class I adenylate-forming enzyme family protein, partial [Betaproteobacteria bacterium]
MPNDARSTRELIRAAHGYADTGPDVLRVSYHSLGAVLRDRAAAQPDAVFLKYFDDDAGESAVWSYRQFAQHVDAAAVFLTGLGLQAGDCFATLSNNHPVPAVLLFAAWKLGLIVAPQNVSEDDARIAFILRDAEAKLLIAHPALRNRAQRLAADASQVKQVLSFDDMPSGDTSVSLAALATPAEADYRRQPALLVYTSGTTGHPKGVLLTQYNLMINATGIIAWHGLDAHTRLMCVLPIHHVNGIVVTLITALMAGTSLVLNRGFKVSTFWKRLSEEGVAIVSVVPTILQFLCEADEDLSAHDLSRFHYFLCGAGTLPVSLVDRFETRFGVPVLHGYGLSETTAFTCAMPPGMDVASRRHLYAHFGYPSIGTVFPHCEMAIHDPDGRDLARGERGEIVIRGHYIMDGYFHRPDANAETFKHAWFRSGDEGFFETDEQGRPYYFITGRLKELINRGGVKYSPFEIEEVLLSIPGVSVGLAIAFDNDWYGEEVGAYVVRVAGSAVTEA